MFIICMYAEEDAARKKAEEEGRIKIVENLNVCTVCGERFGKNVVSCLFCEQIAKRKAAEEAVSKKAEQTKRKVDQFQSSLKNSRNVYIYIYICVCSSKKNSKSLKVATVYIYI